MDDLAGIDNFEDLDRWMVKRKRKYNIVFVNLSIFRETIFPEDKLNSHLEEDIIYDNLKKKMDETKRNCNIIFRKMEIYQEMLESDEEFEIIKEYCLEIQDLHKRYAKTWNGIASSIRSTVRYINEKERE